MGLIVVNRCFFEILVILGYNFFLYLEWQKIRVVKIRGEGEIECQEGVSGIDLLLILVRFLFV